MATSAPAAAEIAAVIGNPARANVLTALLDGRALTAKELAYAAGVSPQTTSGHLARLTDARLLAVTRQGRYAYFRLASPQVARMLESIMVVAADGPKPRRPRWRADSGLRVARTCYDHLAGRLGVALADVLAERAHVVLDADGGIVTPAGAAFLGRLGIDVTVLAQERRAFCRPCLDWSERRPHLAGAVGAALAGRCFSLGWITRSRDSRALEVCATGHEGFRDMFGIDLAALADAGP